MGGGESTPVRRSERSRAAILRATGELVFELSYAKLTIEAIAARAGVGKQTIYRWWPSKGAVVFDAVLELGNGSDGKAVASTGDFAADLRALLRESVAELTDPRFDAFLRALTIEMLQDPALAADFHDRLLGPQRRAIRDRLAAAVADGQIRRDVDLDAAVDLIVSPVQTRWSQDKTALTVEYADVLTDLILHAIGTGK